jgi:uncharacterized protein (UPF0248 family)
MLDVLRRLKWDEKLNINHFRIGYVERFDGIKEMAARSWISESTDEDWIPQHRIRYFKRLKDDSSYEKVWDRDDRIDNIFGQGENSLDTAASNQLEVQSDDGGVRLPV